MTKHESLIRRLCEASEGSAELSAEVWTALTGIAHKVHTDGRVWTNEIAARLTRKPCLTTSLSAAWGEAERRGYEILLQSWAGGAYRESGPFFRYSCSLVGVSGKSCDAVQARTPALALCAAMLAAEGER